MYFPTYHINRFYKDPDSVVKLANSFEYRKPSEGNYPGVRVNIFDANKDLFNYSCAKAIRLITGGEGFSFTAQNSFQKITYNDVKDFEGWIHTDNDSMLTVIIYLSKTNLSRKGTTVYKPKIEGVALQDQTAKYKNNSGDKISDEEYQNALKNNNQNFEPLFTSYANYNSAVMFDGCNYHGAHFDLQPGEERLTQVIFFENISIERIPIVNFDRTV